MGLSEARARDLARSTARRLPTIRRRLVDEAGGPTPEWATSSTPHSLVALVLVGQWNGDHEGDKEIVAEIVGQPYEEVERDLTGLTSVPDSPLTKVGNRWRLTSHEEAWHLLAPRLTSSDVERLERVATSCSKRSHPSSSCQLKNGTWRMSTVRSFHIAAPCVRVWHGA